MSSFVGRKFSRMESVAGPFHEPERPHPIVDLADARGRFDELESLLERLEDARRRSWSSVAWISLMCIVLLLAFSGFRPSAPEVATIIAVGLAFGLWDNVVYWISWPGQSRSITGFFTLHAPSYESILACARSSYDAMLGLRDEQRRELLGSLLETHPRVQQAAQASWTFVPRSMKAELRRPA